MVFWKKAHDYVRKIGKQCKARLVIWGGHGSKVRERIIHPRITVMPETYEPTKVDHQHFEAQILDGIKLPTVLMDHPILLLHLMMAQSYYDQYQFEKAGIEFEKCLKNPQQHVAGETEILFWLAWTLHKIMLKSSDILKEKRGGFRVII